MLRSTNMLFAVVLFLFSDPALALCDIFEDPPINEVNCGDVQTNSVDPGFTMVKPDPAGFGLFNHGGISVAIAASMTGTESLIGTVTPNTVQPTNAGLRAVPVNSQWVDVKIKQVSSSYVIEMQRYELNSLNQPVLVNTVQSSALAIGLSTNFDLSYVFHQGALTLNVSTPASSTPIAQLSASNFGANLPSMKIRRGTQPSGAGVASVAFTQVSHWGN